MQLEVKNNIGTISANFETVKEALERHLSAYEIEVTSNTVKDAKKDMAELNKLKKSINDKVKEVSEEYSKPLNLFKTQAKGLIELVENSRNHITTQVKVFEDAKRIEALTKIKKYADSMANLKGLKEDYLYSIKLESAVSLTALTTKGELSKSAKDAVDALIAQAYAQQAQDEAQAKQMRLLREKEEAEQALLIEKRANQIAQERTESAPKVQDAPTISASEGKSVYRITFTYDIKTKKGADKDALANYVLEQIKQGNLNANNVDVKEY